MKRTVKAWVSVGRDGRMRRPWTIGGDHIAAFASKYDACDYYEGVSPCTITYDDGRPARRRKGGKK